MKKLYLLRHAKSSWEYPALSDLKRPLNQRGNRDAPKIGKWLKASKIQLPDLVICSPSSRTLETISKLGHAWGLEREDFKTDPELYHASTATLWQMLHKSPNQANTLMLLGHNPGFTEFANQICPAQNLNNIPTCAIFAVGFHCHQWAETSTKNAEFLFFQSPKMLKESS